MNDILDHELTQGEFAFYREFHTLEQTQYYVPLLEENNILYKLETPSELLIDKAIVGEKLGPQVILKILPRDFSRVNQLIEERIESEPVPAEHYLLMFDDLELFDILEQPDEWTIEDRALTRKILRQRGLEVSPEQIQQMKEERYRALRQGKKEEPYWLIIYLVCIFIGLFFFSPLFLLAGLGMGYYYWQDKSTDPEGRRYYTFEGGTRQWGQYIFVSGLIVSALYMAYFIIGGKAWF